MNESQVAPHRWRFGLRTLLVATTVFAIWCGFVAILPVAFSQLAVGLIWIVAASLLVTGLFFAAGDQRAFCIGASMVLSSMWTGVGGRFMQGVHDVFNLFFGGLALPQSITLWFDLAVHVALAVANGYLCVRAHGFFVSQAVKP